MPSQNSVSVRRNGKPQSCEPCRKSKVRCDHKTPICDRCIARGVEEKCIYHPAPLTRVISKPSSPSIRTPRATPVPRISHSVSGSVSNGPGNPRPLVRSPLAARATPAIDAEYLGSTSFSAVIDDDREIVNQHTERISAQEMLGDSDTSGAQISEERIVAGINVLKLLADIPDMGEIIERYYSLSYTQMVPNPIIKLCVASMEETFHGAHPASRDWRKDVLGAFENTYRPMKIFNSVRAKDYHNLFTGNNLRWEIVGFVLALVGISLKYDANGRSDMALGGLTPERADLIQRISDAIEYCVSFCQTCSSITHQTLWLFYAYTGFNTLVHGDGSFQAWRLVGDLSSMFFALGLHEDVKHTGDTPYYQCELRRRYAAQIFCIDKTISTLLGRPPRISGRYCVTVLPIDIADEVLLLEDDELQAAISNVDADGWSLDRKFRNSTWRRIKMIISQFREEVLEVYLGRNQTDTDERAHDILARHEIAWARVPNQLKYNEFIPCEHIAPPQRYVMMMGYMDQQYNRFLLHRKLVKDTLCSRKTLYEISMSLLCTVLQTISLSDQFFAIQKDLSWLILYYGLPGASILAVDLLKQSGQTHKITNEHIDMIPRSKVIRNLSVFISCMQRTVDRKEVNLESCRWAGRVLSCILDEIIEPKHYMNITEAPGVAVANIPLPTNEELDQNPVNVDDFLNWVEEVD